MSDYNPFRRSGGETNIFRQAQPGSNPFRRDSGGARVMRPRQQPLYGYAADIEEEHERRRLHEVVIDILSFDQYMGANIAEDVAAGRPNPFWSGTRGALEAVFTPGGRRGDWTNVLLGGPSTIEGAPDQQGILADMPGGPDAPFGQRLARGAIGFGANVILSPTTYLTFGAAGVAKQGGKQFAKQAVDVARRQVLTDPDAARRVFGSRAGRRGMTQEQRLKAIGDGPMNQYLSRVHVDARREFAQSTPAELRKKVTANLEAQKRNAVDTQASLRKAKGEWADEARQEAEERIASIDRQLAQIGDDDYWTNSAMGKGAGEGRVGFMGIRSQTPDGIRRSIAHVGAAVRRFVRENPVTGRFLNGWWASQTNGVIGAIRHHLGFFRSGYQTMLREMELANKGNLDAFYRRNAEQVEEVLQDTTEEAKAGVLTLMRAVQDGGMDVLQNPATLARLPAEAREATLELWAKVRNLTGDWERQATLIRGRIGAAAASAGDELTEATAQQAARQFQVQDLGRAVLGDAAEDVGADPLREFLMRSSDRNAKAQATNTLLEQFREMGIDVGLLRRTDPEDAAGQQLRDGILRTFDAGNNDALRSIGLHTIPGNPMMRGRIFDGEVARIIQNTTRAAKDPNAIANFLRGYTRWWQGILTLRPGFHARNIMGNWMMTFMRLGPRAMNPNYALDGAAAAAKELQGDTRWASALKTMMREPGMRSRLSRDYGGYTVDELAEKARRYGVISRTTHAGDPTDVPDVALKRAKGDPRRWATGAFEASRNFGAVTESAQRMGYMLAKLDEFVRRGVRITDDEIEFVAMDARKGLVDYQDLTPTEQRFGKTLFPFYAWTRHAAFLMVDNIIHHPGNMAMLEKGLEAIGETVGGGDIERASMAPWMREMNLRPSGEIDGKQMMFALGQPWTELNLFDVGAKGGAVGMLGEIIERANPLVKGTVEAVTKRNLFFDKEVAGFERAPRALQVLRQFPRVLLVLDGAARIGWNPRRGMGFTDQHGRPREDNQGRLLMDGPTARILENYFPVLDYIGRAVAGPAWALEQLGVNTNRALGETKPEATDEDNLRRFLQGLSWLTGVTVREHNPRVEAFYRRQEALERMRQERRAQGRGPRIITQ